MAHQTTIVTRTQRDSSAGSPFPSAFVKLKKASCPIPVHYWGAGCNYTSILPTRHGGTREPSHGRAGDRIRIPRPMRPCGLCGSQLAGTERARLRPRLVDSDSTWGYDAGPPRNALRCGEVCFVSLAHKPNRTKRVYGSSHDAGCACMHTLVCPRVPGVPPHSTPGSGLSAVTANPQTVCVAPQKSAHSGSCAHPAGPPAAIHMNMRSITVARRILVQLQVAWQA